MIIISDIKQGSPKWFQLRAGKFTGSEIHKIMGVKGFGQTGESYIYEVAASQETGLCNPEISNFAMDRGKEFEDTARLTFSFKYNVDVLECGSFISEEMPEVMASPDGYFRKEDEGFYGLEIKCPLNQGIHLKYRQIKNAEDLKSIKIEYYWQIQMCLMISDFQAWYFVSFHPNFPANKLWHCAKIKRVEPDIILLKSRISEAIKLKNKYLEL
jgi:putative phage-type endonuclease